MYPAIKLLLTGSVLVKSENIILSIHQLLASKYQYIEWGLHPKYNFSGIFNVGSSIPLTLLQTFHIIQKHLC